MTLLATCIFEHQMQHIDMLQLKYSDQNEPSANSSTYRDIRPHETRFIAGNENRVGTVLGNVTYNMISIAEQTELQPNVLNCTQHLIRRALPI